MTHEQNIELVKTFKVSDITKVTARSLSGCTWVKTKKQGVYDGNRTIDHLKQAMAYEYKVADFMGRVAVHIERASTQDNVLDMLQTVDAEYIPANWQITVKSKKYVIIQFHGYYIHAEKTA